MVGARPGWCGAGGVRADVVWHSSPGHGRGPRSTPVRAATRLAIATSAATDHPDPATTTPTDGRRDRRRGRRHAVRGLPLRRPRRPGRGATSPARSGSAAPCGHLALVPDRTRGHADNQSPVGRRAGARGSGEQGEAVDVGEDRVAPGRRAPGAGAKSGPITYGVGRAATRPPSRNVRSSTNPSCVSLHEVHVEHEVAERVHDEPALVTLHVLHPVRVTAAPRSSPRRPAAARPPAAGRAPARCVYWSPQCGSTMVTSVRAASRRTRAASRSSSAGTIDAGTRLHVQAGRPGRVGSRPPGLPDRVEGEEPDPHALRARPPPGARPRPGRRPRRPARCPSRRTPSRSRPAPPARSRRCGCWPG